MILGVPKSMVVRLGWVALTYGAVQFLRLLNNVILTRLLEPSVFGLMSLVVAIRVGMELVSDLGVTQNIVSNPRGHESQFYDTAWTLHASRNIVLAVLCFLLAAPFAIFFGHPELAIILPVASLFFVLSGFESTTRGVLHKQLEVARLGFYEISLAAVSILAQVGSALVFRNVWAVMVGMMITSGATLVATYFLIPGTRHRFMVDPQSARELLHFGKWVFLSSIVYFFAMNFDRLYFAKQITLAELGVYGIARNLADVISQLVTRASGFVLYPTVAASGLPPQELRQKLLRGRRTLLLGAAVGLGLFMALAGVIVGLLYDPRYGQAGVILPILCVGVWFGILTSTNDSILMGLSRPAYPAISNAAKLVTYLVGAPLAFHFYGFMAAVAVIAGGEIVKYVTLWALSHKEHLRFGRDDLVLTLAFGGTALAISEILRLLGVTGSHPLQLRAIAGALGL
jgi:O-antigen/teichoic acid export membrane protein